MINGTVRSVRVDAVIKEVHRFLYDFDGCMVAEIAKDKHYLVIKIPGTLPSVKLKAIRG